DRRENERRDAGRGAGDGDRDSQAGKKPAARREWNRMPAHEIVNRVPPATEPGEMVDPVPQRPAKRVEEELIARRSAECPRHEHAPIPERTGRDGQACDDEYGFAFDHGGHVHAEVRERVHAEYLTCRPGPLGSGIEAGPKGPALL